MLRVARSLLVPALALSLSGWTSGPIATAEPSSTSLATIPSRGGLCSPFADIKKCPEKPKIDIDCTDPANWDKAECEVAASQPGATAPATTTRRPAGPRVCTDYGHTIPCQDPEYGWWNNSDNCYYRPATPQPPPTDPVWAGHYPQGTVYVRLCLKRSAALDPPVWRADAPPAAALTPELQAQQAFATLTLPKPVPHRSPPETNNDHGTPYTWVNLWTWYWTEPGTWRPLTARAQAGNVWTSITVTPTRLVYSPGEAGATDVSCTGPGRAWTEPDANDPPTRGGCGYRYRHVSAKPITATVSIEWEVTWRAYNGTSGTLPTMRTSASSRFIVEQIQVVNR